MTLSPAVERLAAAHGVATSYEDQLQRTVHVAESSVVAVLAALGVDASTPAAVEAALDDVDRQPATPPVVVLRESQTTTVAAQTVHGLILETGEEVPCRSESGTVTLDGARLGQGWHVLRSDERDITVIVAPDRLP